MKRALPVFAVLLGPGVGQALVGRRVTAAIFVGAFVASLGVLAFTIYALPVVLGVVLAALVEIVVHVVRNPAPARRDDVAAGVAFGVVAASTILAKLFLVEAFTIPASSMAPTLRIDDSLFITKLERSPARGDVIVFDHPCHPRVAYIKRAVALGGDTVEVRCNVLYVNGRAAPLELVKADDTYRDRDESLDGADPWYERKASRYRETLHGRTYEVFHEPERTNDRDFPEQLPACSSGDYGADIQRPGAIVDADPVDDPCKPHRHYVVPKGHVFTLGDNRSNSNDSRYWGSVPLAYIKGTVTGVWLPTERFGPVQ